MAIRRIVMGRVIGIVALGLLPACGVLAPLPDPSSLQDRAHSIPTEGTPIDSPVTIYWDSHQIPFIEASSDTDAAFALGLVHAHLRLGQMEMFRRISQGRIAEMGGPLATDIDHGLRILDFSRVASEIEAGLPDETRAWLGSFVAGINYYAENAASLPAEFEILGLEREVWTVRDIIVMGRLAATDVNWLVWFNLLPMRQRADWPQLWTRLVGNGSVPLLESSGREDRLRLADILAGTSRSGSNSVAVGPSRTATGSAIMANDPHLGLLIPNLWLIVGVKSPSYHAVGLMASGLPLFAIGRNPAVAWGGTNLRAAASELVDLSELSPPEITSRQETIGVRWWLDEDVTIRETKWGPILSDAPQLADLDGPEFALRWIGNMPSDEFTTFLKVSRAQDFEAFKAAFDSFAVPGQNMLYADRAGNIGMIMAVRLPRRNGEPPADLIVSEDAHTADWRSTVGTADLPSKMNPELGYLVSANNDPGPAPVPVGYFFSPDDRVERMTEIIEGTDTVGFETLARLQQDVYMKTSVLLRDLLVARINALDLSGDIAPGEAEAVEMIEMWDGHYRAESRAAAVFEAFRAAFLAEFYEVSLGDQDWAAYAGIDRAQRLTREDIATVDETRLRAALGAGLAAAAAAAESGDSWGDRHRLVVQHPLGNLPLVGDRFQFGDFPAGGSSEALMKTAHGPAGERHAVRYGSNARHISDLADPDANYFVLLGGQDGWFNSAAFLDQIPLWRQGQYIKVPLTLEAVRKGAVGETVLRP
ncbi:MAG: penicillin acylase family protein [Alphaproteobacteria bacterium]|nr:penicillin acylase family protein [Alphaproteobacteria bacterium]